MELLNQAISHLQATLEDFYETDEEQEKVEAELELVWQLLLEKFPRYA